MTKQSKLVKKLVAAAASVLAGCALVGAWAIAQTPQTAQKVTEKAKNEVKTPVAGVSTASAATTNVASIAVVEGMPAVIDPKNLYSETAAGKMSAAVNSALDRVYVPNRGENTVSVIDPTTMKVVDKFKVGINPQHVVPSWDLGTLWVANNAEGRTDGSLTPIDPKTSKSGKSIPVDDPYNVYFSPDGKYLIVVAEAYKRLDFRDPKTMAMKFSIATPTCAGINHADFSIDGKFAVFTCEFNGAITKIDMVNRKVLATLKLNAYLDRPNALAAIKQANTQVSSQASTAEAGKVSTKMRYIADPDSPGNQICITPGMPQDVRSSPDGSTFFIADMMVDGVHVVDGESFKQIGFIPTGKGAHGIYPSRDGKSIYVANRGSNKIRGTPNGPGSVSVIDFASRKVTKTWTIPGGGSPDMGNVSANGKHLWLSGRYDDVVYRFDTDTGDVEKVKVGREPHGLTVWPQPGRYSLGHTGNLR